MYNHPFVPLRHRQVRMLWSAAMISDIGTWVQLIVVGSLVAAGTGSAIQTGLIALATFAPQGISAPIGGLLADRYDRRKVFARALAVQAVFTSGLAVALGFGVRTPGILTIFILLASAAGALGAPAYAAMQPDLVPAEELMAMVSLGVYSWNGGRILGPLVGSALAFWVGPAWTVAFNAATFAVMAFAVTRLRRSFPSSGEAGSVGERLASGWRALRSTPGCWHGVVILVLFNLTIVPFMGLIPIYAKANFDGGTGLAGLMSSAQGVGAIIGGICTAFIAHHVSRSAMTVGIIAYLATALAGFAAAPNAATAVVGAAFLGAGAASVFITLSAIVQRDAPVALRGRVMALNQAAMGVSYGAGLMFIGSLADTFDLRIAFATGAVSLVIGFGMLVRRSRHWRRAVDGTDVQQSVRVAQPGEAATAV